MARNRGPAGRGLFGTCLPGTSRTISARSPFRALPPRDDQPDNDRADPASDQRGRVGPLPKAEVEQDEPGGDEDIREARLHRVPFRPMAGRLTLEIAAGFFCISPRASRISRSENGVDTLPISRIAKI